MTGHCCWISCACISRTSRFFPGCCPYANHMVVVFCRTRSIHSCEGRDGFTPLDAPATGWIDVSEDVSTSCQGAERLPLISANLLLQLRRGDWISASARRTTRARDCGVVSQLVSSLGLIPYLEDRAQARSSLFDVSSLSFILPTSALHSDLSSNSSLVILHPSTWSQCRPLDPATHLTRSQ